MMLVPDELCADIYNKQVAPYMTEEKNSGRVDIESNQIILTDKEEKQVYKTGLMNDPELTLSLIHIFSQCLRHCQLPRRGSFSGG